MASFVFPERDPSEPIDSYRLRRLTAHDLWQVQRNPMLAKRGDDGVPLYRISTGGRLVRAKPLSHYRRNKAVERDGHACIWCGSTQQLEVDHIVRYADGGSNAHDNLRTLCHDCHADRARSTQQ